VVTVDAFLTANGYTLAMGNEKMYEMAQRTASYKERGVSHENSLREITKALTEFAIPLDVFYRAQKGESELSGFYKSFISIRRSIRRNPKNQLVPSP
jgi:hypothetical protein